MLIEDINSMRYVICIRRRVRAYKRLLEAAKTLTTRDYVRGISRLSTLFNKCDAYLEASLIKVIYII